jgi:L-tartrate/succinate antiporter
MALHLIRLLGDRTLGLGYAVALSDLALAPFTPSNTARSGGTIYPIVKNVPPLYGSLPGPTAPKLGAYLLYTSLAVTCVTSSMFLTGLAPNVLAVGLIGKTAGVTLSWTEWFVGFLPVGLALFLLTPALLFWLYPPEVKSAPEAPRWAGEELTKLGRMTAREYTLLGLVLGTLGLWVAGAGFVDTTMAALVGVAAMVLLGIVSWDDILANKQAWNVLVWFATLVTLAGGLAQVKFVEWVGQTLGPIFAGLPSALGTAVVMGSFFVLHYLFASVTAHTTALLPVFLTVAVGLPGLSPKAWALMLAYTFGIMGVLTPYATGPSPIYFGSGYIAGRDFWRLGAILGAAFLAALILIGVPWLRLLGV